MPRFLYPIEAPLRNANEPVLFRVVGKQSRIERIRHDILGGLVIGQVPFEQAVFRKPARRRSIDNRGSVSRRGRWVVRRELNRLQAADGRKRIGLNPSKVRTCLAGCSRVSSARV